MTRRIDKYTTCDRTVTPLIIIVGKQLLTDASFWTVIGRLRYRSRTLAEALILALKSFFVLHLSYLPETQPLWLLLQRAVLKITMKGEKVTTTLNKIIGSLECTANVKILWHILFSPVWTWHPTWSKLIFFFLTWRYWHVVVCSDFLFVCSKVKKKL